MSTRAGAPMAGTMTGHIIFTDLKGFSILSEPQLRVFYSVLLPALSSRLKEYLAPCVVTNTWGDALFAVFNDVESAVSTALNYRDFFRSFEFIKHGLPRLSPRIACHSGQFEIFPDPLTPSGKNVLGGEINCAARLEPVTRPGEIFVTSYFKDQVERIAALKPEVQFSELGDLMLAKNWGELHVFRMYSKSEKDKQTIDRLIRMNLGEVLPEPSPLTQSEKKTLDACRHEENQETLCARISEKSFDGYGSKFFTELAKICKDFGLYNEAIRYIDISKDMHIVVDGIIIHPHRRDTSLSKTYANCLTRLGRYDEAADIMYGLWQSGAGDADTLSMLAAQYKRRALHGEDGRLLPKGEINIELLTRSRNLYIEAFRRDISSFYSLLNAAYIMSFVCDPLVGCATFTRYLIDAFEPNNPEDYEDWWHAAAIAEAELLSGEIAIACKLFRQATKQFDPKPFELDSTRKQIELYAHLTGKSDELKEIFSILK